MSATTTDSLITLSLIDKSKETAEVRAWLDAAQVKVNAEFELRMRNLLLYGTTHPEFYEGLTP